MKKILVIGAVGQIGSELTMRLREVYGSSNVDLEYAIKEGIRTTGTG